VDFELTQPISGESLREQLARQLPVDMPIYQVSEIDIKASSANQLLVAAEYLLTVSLPERLVETKQWENWLGQIRARKEIWFEHISKSGKQQLINLRDRLFEIELVTVDNSESGSIAGLRYLGSCRPDGVVLRPEQILPMLKVAEDAEFHLLHIHRQRLVLGI
jgi:radical SAM-linked protein